MDSDSLSIIIGTAFVSVFIILLIIDRRATKRKKLRKEKELAEFVEKVENFLEDFTKNGIIPIDCDIDLAKDEHLFALLESVEWKEFRKVRTGNVAGHGISGRVRIAKGVYYRYGAGRVASQSVDQLTTIDSGELYVTNKRFLFRGMTGNKNLPYMKIIMIHPSTSGIEIEKESGKNVFIPYDFQSDPYKIAMIQFCNAIKE